MMGNAVRKEPCPRCRKRGGDTSGDNLTIYDDESSHCFACGYTKPSRQWMEEHGYNDIEEEDEVVTKERITDEELARIKSYTSFKGGGIRGITDETYKTYFCLTKYDEETGEPVSQYYPCFEDYELTGFKVRKLPKEFSTIGKVGKTSNLFGQKNFENASGKFVVICAGEIDTLSAYQMLEESRVSQRKDFEPIPCVSSTVGESGSDKQLALHYEWLNRFERIVVIPDQDDAGKEALKKIVKVLPKGKMWVVDLPEKDINVMLEKGQQKRFVDFFWKMRQYTPAGIVSGGELYQEIVERAKVDKLPFPPMLEKVNKVLAGGINYGYIVNIIAGSGAGKSSLINQIVAFWMKDLDLNVGVVSLEADAGEFGENLLSHYMSRKIALISDRDERLAFVESQEAQAACDELFRREDGSSRLLLLDDRGDFSRLQDKMEELVVTCGCRVIVVDVLSDIFAGMSLEGIDSWMKWSKLFVKRHNAILIHISHVRKSGSGEKTASQGAFLTEESTIGSGTQFRSAGVNIALQRDKNNEDEVVRNTTAVHVLKSRSTGWTGHACDLFYDSDTHTLWDKDVYFTSNKGVKGF